MSMEKRDSTVHGIRALQRFLRKQRRRGKNSLSAVSLFSGAGISDVGYELAGFRFFVQVELDEARAAIGARNFPRSTWIGHDVRHAQDRVGEAYRAACDRPVDLLVATPPCQAMSSSNPSRGKRKSAKAKLNDEKNRLLLALVPIARSLRPRVIVAENVRQILTHTLRAGNDEVHLYRVLSDRLPEYHFFRTCLNVADYGIPQTRHRALIVGINREETCLRRLQAEGKAPWPRGTHSQKASRRGNAWITVRRWFEAMDYPPLSSRGGEQGRDTHPLHFVPQYEEDRYGLVADIPPYSGRSAYENDVCRNCGARRVPRGLAICHACGEPMRNRPIVFEDTRPRLIKGFESSYRRMRPDAPAPTVTTNSSHIGSDSKIHPWEHRVLSILECADLQTVPRFFDWSHAFATKRSYLIRNVIGEAFPSYFTYLHGQALARLLRPTKNPLAGLAPAPR